MKKRNLHNKPFAVVDLGSGSFLKYNEGHETFNKQANPVTGRYYGYAPPYGSLNLMELGGLRSQDKVEDVLIIYVEKYAGTSDRYISAFIDGATVYKKCQLDPSLERKVSKDGKQVDCAYSIESPTLIRIDDIPGAHKFIIRMKDFKTNILRAQRFYKGKHPELDENILNYLENLTMSTLDPDDIGFQEELQEEQEIKTGRGTNAHNEPEYSHGINGKQVCKNTRVSKEALRKANYRCEANPSHATFLNKSGNPYMEGHHLIPCTSVNSEEFWEKYAINIDCGENIVCLCPTCHRQIHYGSHEEREAILKKLFDKRIKILRDLGISISYAKLKKLYSLEEY